MPSEETDPNVLYRLQEELDDYHFYTEEEIETFVEVYLTGGRQDQGRLYAMLGPVVERFKAAEENEQGEFRDKLNDFVRLYAFLAQILPFLETDWEKRFLFGRLLLRSLPAPDNELPSAVREQVALDSYRLHKTFDADIQLQRGAGELAPVGRGGFGEVPEEMDPLSAIIENLNDTYDIKPNGDARAAIEQLQGKLAEDMAVRNSIEVNPPETARLTFDQVANQLFSEMVDNYFEFYRQVTDDPQAKRYFFDWLYDQYRSRAEGQDDD